MASPATLPGMVAAARFLQMGNDPDFANVSLRATFDSGNALTDYSNTGHTLTANGTNGAVVGKFGDGNGRVSTSSVSRVSVPRNADFEFGSGDFTIECWSHRNASALATGGLFGYGVDTGNQRAWRCFRSATVLTFAISSDGTSELTLSGTIANDSGDDYQHVAVDREGNTIRLYLDGVMIDSDTFTGSVHAPSSGELSLSGYWAANAQANHRIDDIRITKGIARYGDDGGFTPPIAALPIS